MSSEHHKLVNQYHRRLALLALAASFFALCVIGLGAFTRLIDAGLGCPDWPGCYGHLTVTAITPLAVKLFPTTPLVAYKAWAEMMHRYFAGTLTLLILAIIGMVCFRARSKGNIILSLIIIILVAYQIILGQWTVTLKLLPVIVTQHLLGGFLILSTLWLIFLNNRVSQPTMSSRLCKNGLLLLAGLGLALLFAQILLGAWTSTHYASLSCTDFPFCSNDHPWQTMQWRQAFSIFTPIGVNYEGGVMPTEVRQTIQMAHRIGALIVSSYLILLMIMVSRTLSTLPKVMKPVIVMVLLLCLQLALGISNVIFKLPLLTAIGHNIIAAVLLLALITLIFNLAQLRWTTA